MAETVVFVGSGGMATVCSMLASSGGAECRMLTKDADRSSELRHDRENARYLPGFALPESLLVTADPEEAFRGATCLVSCIPSQYARAVWARLAAAVPTGIAIATVSKGIENQTLMRPTQVICDALSRHSASGSVGVLSGPTIAEELAAGLPASMVAASADTAFAQRLQSIFNTSTCRIYTNDDLLGVELAGAVKNVVALAAGIVDGLGLGVNAKSALLARGLAEIVRLGVAMGAKPETFFGVAGVGDLATTCFSPTGRNRSCGELLGRGHGLQDAMNRSRGVVEGIATTQSVVALARRNGVEMPIAEALERILFGGEHPLACIRGLMARDPKAESLI